MNDNQELSNLELQLLQEAKERQEFFKIMGIKVEDEAPTETKEDSSQEK